MMLGKSKEEDGKTLKIPLSLQTDRFKFFDH